jgi:hypothetical protein
MSGETPRSSQPQPQGTACRGDKIGFGGSDRAFDERREGGYGSDVGEHGGGRGLEYARWPRRARRVRRVRRVRPGTGGRDGWRREACCWIAPGDPKTMQNSKGGRYLCRRRCHNPRGRTVLRSKDRDEMGETMDEGRVIKERGTFVDETRPGPSRHHYLRRGAIRVSVASETRRFLRIGLAVLPLDMMTWGKPGDAYRWPWVMHGSRIDGNHFSPSAHRPRLLGLGGKTKPTRYNCIRGLVQPSSFGYSHH